MTDAIRNLSLGFLVSATCLACEPPRDDCGNGHTYIYETIAGRLVLEVKIKQAVPSEETAALFPSPIYKNERCFSLQRIGASGYNNSFPNGYSTVFYNNKYSNIENINVPPETGTIQPVFPWNSLFRMERCLNTCRDDETVLGSSYYEYPIVDPSHSACESEFSDTIFHAGVSVPQYVSGPLAFSDIGCSRATSANVAVASAVLERSDIIPVGTTTCIEINARVWDDGSDAMLQSRFQNTTLFGLVSVESIGGISEIHRIYCRADKVIANTLVPVEQSSLEKGYAWRFQRLVEEAPYDSEHLAAQRFGQGMIVRVAAFTENAFDFDNDNSFTQADVDFVTNNIVGTSLATSDLYLRTINLVPYVTNTSVNGNYNSLDVIDSEDVAELQKLLAYRIVPIPADRNDDGVVDCDDWICPDKWTNPSTGLDWRFGESGYVLALDIDGDGIMGTETNGDMYNFYRRLNRCDFNGDGFVDDLDFPIFSAFYNDYLEGGDLNCDSVTDDADFVIFADAYDHVYCTDNPSCN